MKYLIHKIFITLLLAFASTVSAQYSKISNTGSILPETAVLGTGPNDWACTYDSNTRLMWEVKTNDKGLRDKDWVYVLGTSTAASPTTGCQITGRCDTDKFTQDVNAQGLCGASDWRMPNSDELAGLVYCSSGYYNSLPSGAYGEICSKTNSDQKPTISLNFFPNTTTLAPSSGKFLYSPRQNPLFIDFASGAINGDYSFGGGTSHAVRLVRAAYLSAVPGVNNQPPTPRFTVTPSVGTVPLTVQLDASTSADNDGNIVSYTWMSNNGLTAIGSKTSMTFTSFLSFIPGNYPTGKATITLRVTDNQGASSMVTKEIDGIANKAPIASFSVTPSGTSALTIVLDGSASSDSDGSIAQYSWESSDGRITTGQTANLSFLQAGTYSVTLTVTDDKGLTATQKQTVTVATTSTPAPTPTPAGNKLPIADFSATPGSGSSPLTVNLNASASSDSDGTITAYSWSSSDGQSANGKFASFTFTSTGSPYITLVVTDDKGATGSLQKSVEVKPQVIAN